MVLRSSSVLLALLLASSCMTSKEGAALRRDVDELQRQMSVAQLQAQKERKQLQKVMEQATALLTRNNADVGAQVDRLQNKLTKLGGRVEEVSKSLHDVTKKFSDFQAKVDVKLERLQSGAPQQKQPPVPEDKNALYTKARSTVTSGKHKEGRRLLRHFIARFPKDSRVSNAWLLLGESYYAQGKFANAIQEYRKIVEQRKKSKQVPDALFKIGMSFYQLKYCSDARVFLSELLRKYRRYRKIKSARKVLKLIRRFKRNRRICLS